MSSSAATKHHAHKWGASFWGEGWKQCQICGANRPLSRLSEDL